MVPIAGLCVLKKFVSSVTFFQKLGVIRMVKTTARRCVKNVHCRIYVDENLGSRALDARVCVCVCVCVCV